MQSNLLRSELALNNMTANTLAAAIGMRPKTLYNKLNGLTEFTVDEANRICQVLKIEDAEEKVAIFLT